VMKKKAITRRSFLRAGGAVAGAALAAPTIVSSSASGKAGSVAPSNRITVGMIGLGRQTVYTNLKYFVDAPDVQVVALCDVDRWRLAMTNEHVVKVYGNEKRSGKFSDIPRYTDFRELLARKDIDAVMISTPDHWHVPMCVYAVNSGKDVCCEKPLTMSIAEGRLLSDLVTKHKRVFRTDSDFRSTAMVHRTCELVRNGRIGKVHTIRTGVPVDKFTSPPNVEMPVPKGLDYNMWLGPAGKAPYNEHRVHPRHNYTRPGWMRVRGYCDGMITNWGTHLNDAAQWGNNTDRTGPVEVEGRGKYPPAGNMWNVLVEFEINYRYADGVRLIYKTGEVYVRFEGTKGWVEANVSKGNIIRAEPKSILESKIGPNETHLLLKHEKRDFIDCIKTRGRTLEDAEVGHRTTSLCHLGHIAVQVGGKLKWDPHAERFLNSEAANKLLRNPPGRKPWAL